MAIIKQIVNLLLKLLSGSVCVFGVYWVMYLLWCRLSDLNPPGRIFPIINMRDGFYIIMFLGLPFGSTLGIAIVNKLIGEKTRLSKGRMTSAFVGGIIGPLLIMRILPLCGLDIARLLPQFETYGYNVDIVIIPCASAIMALAGDLLWLPTTRLLDQIKRNSSSAL